MFTVLDKLNRSLVSDASRRTSGGRGLVIPNGGLMTVESGGQISGVGQGTVVYVDSVNGLDTNDGSTFLKAFKTATAALAALAELDVLTGNTMAISAPTNTNQLSEAIVIPVTMTGLTIVGLGNGPLGAVWTGAEDAVCVTVNAYDVLIKNIKFRPPAYGSGTPAAIKLSGAWNSVIEDCLFQGKAGSYFGIHSDGNNANVTVRNCEFCYLNYATTVYGTGIGGSGYTVGENSGWRVTGCRFHSNYNHVSVRVRQGLVDGNFFADRGIGAANTAAQTTVHLDISGATVGANVVRANHFCGDYSTASNSYKAGTNDSWVGNFSDDLTETEVTSTSGITIAVPAA